MVVRYGARSPFAFVVDQEPKIKPKLLHTKGCGRQWLIGMGPSLSDSLKRSSSFETTHELNEKTKKLRNGEKKENYQNYTQGRQTKKE
ncbi:hypothetical protein AC249_AIPGENE27762 [Exaiptasia diaphana]|nr:hypothetical protein AC249_AIPGENE27762 [Exaiptasia diaphana]